MKKKKKRIPFGKKLVFMINTEPYNQQCIVVVNGQFSDAEKFYKKWKTPSAQKSVNHIKEERAKNPEVYIDDFEKGNGKLYTGLPKGYVMLLSHEDSWIGTVSTVLHESLHLTHYILRRAGMELCRESEEAYTYLCADISRKILSKIY